MPSDDSITPPIKSPAVVPATSTTAVPVTVPFTPKTIKDAVIKEDDFAFEMKVAALFARYPAYTTLHGGTYTDSVTNKPRQYDFRATITKDAAKVFLAIECKNLSPESPLIICGRPRLSNESFHDLINSRLGTFHTNQTIVHGLSSITQRVYRDDSIYHPDEFTGKSALRLDQKNGKPLSRLQDTDVYEKWSQALASAVDAIGIACAEASVKKCNNYYTAVLPIVAVPDDVLWRCEYDLSGNMILDPAPTDDCPFYIGRSYPAGVGAQTHEYVISHLHFCTLRGLEARISSLATDLNAWAQLLNRRARPVEEHI